MRCKICGSDQKELFQSQIMCQMTVKYYHCLQCGFICTEKPTWLDEAYGSAIAALDIGLLRRNIDLSKRVSAIISKLFPVKGNFVDLAGGYGVFTRLMRDRGFNFFWEDRYCENIFAHNFEANKHSLQVEALTAFEVLEHLENPFEFIEDSLKRFNTKTIIFSTELYSPPEPQKNWWYYFFETGQHISFFQRRTLEVIADKLGLHLYSYKNIHMLTDKKVNRLIYKVCGSKIGKLLALWLTRNMVSLVESDLQMIREKK